MGDGFKYSFLTVYIIEILITLVILPFLIRLSGQLFIQSLKSYETIKNASDPEEHRPYYDHYRIMFCLLFVMLMTSVFNLIKSFYLIKPFFLYYVEPISLNLVLNFWFSFQDAIISFGLLAMLQVMYFFQEKKMNFRGYITLTILRFFWVLLVESSLLISEIFKNTIYFQTLTKYIIMPTLLIYLIRFVLIFRFSKEGNDIVKKLINGILSDDNLRNAMGHERVENIYRATILFRCLSWGNFVLAMFFCIPPLVELIYYFPPISFYLEIYLSPEVINSKIYFSSVLFNELIFFFASILYAIFFLILWKFLFDRTKAQFSGYSHFNENRTLPTNETTPILNQITFSGMKSQKILLRYYSIVISCITVIMVGFITPLVVNGWSSLLFVNSGDYYKLKHTNLYKAMESCSKVTAEIYYPIYEDNSSHCDSIYFATIGDSVTPLYQKTVQLSNISYEHVLWVPPNTMITGLNNINSLNISLIIPTDVPCMTADEQSIALEQRFIIFDCVIPEYNRTKFIANCSNSNQCQSFHETILNKSSMINIAVDPIYDNNLTTFSLLKQTYNLSNLSNVKQIIDFQNSESEFNWQNYDILISKETHRDLDHLDYCPIKFSCTLHYAIVITISLFTLISIPVYLMVSVILIHRH